MPDRPLYSSMSHLERSFRDLIAADQARELLRQEAAAFVLLCLYTEATRDQHESQ